jgi:uncharacterized membrane protein YpjA
MFRFYFNQLSKISRGFAVSVFITGMLFIGFSMLIFAIPAFFGILAAIAFFIIGIGIVSYGIKLLMALGQMNRRMENPEEAERENVRVHRQEHYFEEL